MLLSPLLDELAHSADLAREKEKKKLLRKLRLGGPVSAWQFLVNHPIFKDYNGSGQFPSQCLHIRVDKVNSKGIVQNSNCKNTRTEVWLECWPMGEVKWRPFLVPSHDPLLECTATTFEKAIVKMAKLVFEHYGEGQNEQ